MTLTRRGIETMRETTKSWVKHYGKGPAKIIFTRLHTSIGVISFHRVCSSIPTLETALKNKLLQDDLDVMEDLAQSWLLMMDGEATSDAFLSTTADIMLSCLSPEEPPVPKLPITSGLKQYPIVLAMYYFRHAFVLGELES